MTRGGQQDLRRDADGRECYSCNKYKPWAEFDRSAHDTDGHASQCKLCKREYRVRGPKRQLVKCSMCGDPMDATDTQQTRCTICTRRAHAWHNRKVYLVVGNSAWVRLGGHFDHEDFKVTLEDNGWPDGMLVEEWIRGTYKRTCRVKSTKLWTVRGTQPIGDGKWLLTGHEPMVELDYDDEKL